MVTIEGKSVYGGIAIGTINYLTREKNNVRKRKITDVKKEIEKFEQGKEEAKNELQSLYEKALIEVGETNAAIFDIHKMMVNDEDFNNYVINIITSQKVNCEYAVFETGENFSHIFAAMDDEYMKARAADVKDVAQRIVNCMLNKKSTPQTNKSQKVIVCADDLTPSETVQLDKENVLAFVTSYGSSNSHTAILARTMNIPAIINVGDKLDETVDGKYAIVDGFGGKLYVDPDDDTIKDMKKKLQEDIKAKNLLEELKGKENITKDGTKIEVYANIGGLGDLGAVVVNDAGGIGLFRSEFLYLESNDFPDEEQQLLCYKKVLENMVGKLTVIRTMDVGADKKIGYFNLPAEENPAMGYRAIRICLTKKNIFKTQLRALLRASIYGNLAIMFPMITSEWEIKEIKKIVNEVKKELDSQNIKYNKKIQLGIMIETPAAVVISDILAKHVDFFSLGTNDLTQYTLAVDRQNQKIEKFYDPHHESILRMIEYVIKNAHKENIWVGICGELASDLTLTETFLKMGIDELSVSPPLVLKLRDKIRKIDLSNNK